MNFKESYGERQKKVDGYLQQYMEKIQDQIPQTLFEAMNYSVKNGGKRLRPILLLETAKQEKEATNEAVALACALELIHTYSLVHDDLPAMDNDDLRRGKPTNHIVFGEDLAILAGDGLLNYAYEIMLEEGVATGNAGYRKAMATIAKAAGSKGMVGGQADDIQNEHVEMDLATLDRINARKTGALFKAAVIAGGQYLQMDEKKLAQLEIYAECTGKAYQIVDDLLDVEGDREKIGKNIGHDAQTGKKTYPALCGLDQSRNKVAELYEQAMAALEESGCQSPFLKELTHFLFYRDY